MMSSEIFFIITWWFLFLVVGLVGIPLCWYLFRRFTDLGYALSKILGFAILTYVAFLTSIFRLAPLTNTVLFLIFGLYLIANSIIFAKNSQKIAKAITKKLRPIAFQEVFFTAGLVFWVIIRGYQPTINGLEKFMDFGFINSILKTKYLPPTDMWFAGKPINYYWFGHLWTAIATKLSNIPPEVTYNLMIATILGLTLTSAFSIVSTLIRRLNIRFGVKTAFAAGIISALILTFAGNFHTPIYVLKNGPQKYWYPDATRFIGYHPETNDKTIHEFPIYSFVVSDLHAHLINLPFVLLYIALLANYVVNTRSKAQFSNPKSRILPLGFVLGVMFMTNTWDFANYLLVTGVTLGLLSLTRRKINFNSLLDTAVSFISILLLGLLMALPFILNFTSLAQGIKFVNSHTPLWQLAVLWGFPATLTVIFVSFIYRERKKAKLPDIFVLALIISSWILIAIPEIIYVKDIYIASHYRANTMFKLTYQAFVMLYLSSGYIAIRTIRLVKKAHFKTLLLAFYAIVFASVLIYPSFAINSYYGELKKYQGLRGDRWLKTRYPSEYGVVNWLKQNVVGQPVILEAPGDSYTDFNLISSYTGLPTVSGWFVHEWLWRGGASIPEERVADIAQIYTSNEVNLTKALLRKYEVEYVIIGTFERKKFPNLNEAKFSTLGTQVFSSGNTRVYQVR